MTLPLIYTINNVNKELKGHILNIIKNHNKDEKKVNEVIEIVKNNGGIEYSKK